MTSHDDRDDEEFEAFLQGRDALAQQLKALPQPAPSAQLSAAILADAEAALARQASANDAVIPHARQPAPHFLRRLRLPLALAAGLAVVVMAGLQWRQSNPPTVVAQADPAPVWRSGPEFAPAPGVQTPAQQKANEKANAWVVQIEKLLAAGKTDEALAEWKKFRKEYPRHPVSERLDARIGELKK